MELEAGKRYVRRDGEVTAPLVTRVHLTHPFFDPWYHISYRSDGAWIARVPHDRDLVKEYHEA